MWIFYLLAALAAFLVLYLAAVSWFVYRITVVRWDKGIDYNYDPSTPAESFSVPGNSPYRLATRDCNIWWNRQPLERYTIVSHDGLALAGYLLRAETSSRRVALVLHGHQCVAGEMGFVAAELHQLGFHVLVPDQRAHGKSAGRFYGMGVLERLDALRWLAFINALLGDDCEIVLHGLSMGAAAVMLAAAEPDLPNNVVCAIEDCGFTCVDQSILAALRGDRRAPILKPLIISIASLMARLRAGYFFRQTDCLAALPRCRLPMLFIHGTDDPTAPFLMQKQLYDAHPGPKELLAVEGAKHGVSYFAAPELYATTMKKFIDAHTTQ